MPTLADRRAVWNTIRGSSGNLVEWYDVYVYTVFAVYFEDHFFDEADKNATVYVYAIFALTFLTRPVGAWFFGRFADRRGRRAALTASVSVMAACSLMIAMVPSRATIGIAAPAILVLCRLVQGFATGGEYGTSATYMSEAATRGRRGFFSSFHYLTLVGGHVLAQFTLLVLLSILDNRQVHEFGWRIAFAIGALVAVVVFWLRRSMDESLRAEQLAAVQSGADTTSGSMAELFTRHRGPLVMCFLMTMGGTLAFYTYSVNAPAIVKATYQDRAMVATWINLLGLILLMALQPIGGMISDRVGRKPLLLWFGFGGLGYTYVLITYLPQTHSATMSFLLVAVGYVILTGYTCTSALVKAELFPSHVRALGVGVGYALANSTFGGTAPVIYQALKQHDQIPLFIAYATACIAVSLLVYLFFFKNKALTPLDRESGAASFEFDTPHCGAK